ncbi:MAG: helix-turn-helix domain-containing protein [Chloroflexota bacterium]
MNKGHAILEMTVNYNGTNIRLAVSDTDLQDGFAKMLTYVGLLLNDDGSFPEQLDVQLLQTLQQQHRLAQGGPQPSPQQIWFDAHMDCLKRGNDCLPHLTPTERNLLLFFVQQPYKQHTYSELCAVGWPSDHINGVTPECIYQMIRGLRSKIEFDPKQPQYIVNWRGNPEGGYRFFPLGNEQIN